MKLFGFLNCNKPPGMTSRDVVNIVQRRLARKTKIGHAGTLDPLAEGVLVLAVGSASRLVPYVQQQQKHYRARFRLGSSSISGDLEGNVTEHPGLAVPTLEQLQSAATALTGKIQQVPPAHSAVWVDGQRAYKRIRAGEVFEMPERTVEVDSLEIISYDYPLVQLDIACGSGTYIRSLGLDLAIAAGSTAVMEHLTRTAVGPFDLSDAATVDQLREAELEPLMLPANHGIEGLHQFSINEAQAVRLGHGLPIEAAGDPVIAEAAALMPTGQLRAIVKRLENQWKPHRVFPVD